MGRYDKIKYWNGSEWVQPNHIKMCALLKNIRYIYVYQNGSTVNRSNHLCQIEAYTSDGVNVAIGKTVTCGGASGLVVQNPGNCVKASLDDSFAEVYLNGSSYQDGRTWFIIDLGQGYDLDYIKVWRYYPDGRTYYETAICVIDTNGTETRLHEYTQDPLYAETIDGYKGDCWIDYGDNNSDSKRPIYAWDGSSWVRKTLNKTIHYGDKEWYCNASGGGGEFEVNSSANINNSVFEFSFYVSRDYDSDKNIAFFGSSSIRLKSWLRSRWTNSLDYSL